MTHRRFGQLARIYLRQVAIDWPRVHEGLPRDRGHRHRIALVYVDRAIHVPYRVIVIDIRHLRHVYPCIRDVHIVYVNPAHPVRRNVNFSRPQGKPGDSLSDAYREMKASPTNKRD